MLGLFKRRAEIQYIESKPEIKVVHSTSHDMTVAECRKDERVVSMCQQALLNPSVAFMLRAVENSHPARFVLPGNVGTEARGIMQGRIEGYEMAITNLRSLGTMQKQQKQPEATFEQPTNKT
jgi:hypothetical protein